MSETESKTCPLCCEPVRPGARKCPHCHHFLNKWVLAAYHPLVAISPLLLMFAVGCYLLARALHRGADFESFRSQVRVTRSELEFGELPPPAGQTVAVVGTIQNDSTIGWKDLVIEARFFDASHKLIDTRQKRDYVLSLPARGDCAFKFTQPREFDRGGYVSHEVRVVSARDANGFMQ